jgi:hypothetical protein
VALPHGSVRPGQHVDRRQPAACPHPAGDRPLEETLPAARRRTAGERPAQERVGAVAPAGRRIERVALHADLTMVARLACALAKARAAPLAA